MGVPSPTDYQHARPMHASGCWRWDWDGDKWVPLEYSSYAVWSKQLRERMRELGWFYVLQCRQSDKQISACIWRPVEDEHAITINEGYAISDTEEMAVALAALKALGVSTDTDPAESAQHPVRP